MIAYLYILAITLAVVAVIVRLLPRQLVYPASLGGAESVGGANPLANLFGKREIALVIYLPTVASLSPNYLIFSVLVVGFMAFVPAKPEERLRLVILALPLLPPLNYIVPAPPPINSLIAVNYNLLLFLGAAGLVSALRPKGGGRFGIFDLGIALFIVSLLIAAVRGTSLTNALRTLLEFTLVVGLPYYMLSRGGAVVRSPRDLLMALIFAGTIVAAVTIFESQRNWLLYSPMGSGMGLSDGISSYAKQRGGFLRASATFSEPTSLSLFLALTTVLLVALRNQFRRRALFYFLLTVLVLGQVFAVARIGPFTTVAGVAALLWYEKRYALLTLSAVAFPLLYFTALFAAAYVPVLGALMGLSDGASSTVDYRELLADRMMEEIALDPWLGLTNDQIQVRLNDMRQGEGIIDLVNTHLSVMLRSGVVGFVLFIFSSLVTVVALIRVRSIKQEADLAAVCSALFAGLMALHIGLYTTGFQIRNQLWLVLLLSLSAGLVVRVRQASRKKAATSVPNFESMMQARTPVQSDQAPA